jgi:hypothetical protein
VLNASAPGNAMGCTEFQLQGIKRQDLADFAAACHVPHVAVDHVRGLGGRLIPGVEALLDVEYMEAVAAPIPLTVTRGAARSWGWGFHWILCLVETRLKSACDCRSAATLQNGFGLRRILFKKMFTRDVLR